MNQVKFHREQLQLEWAVVLRFALLCVPVAITSAVAWWVFSVEDSPSFWRVLAGVPAGMFWYLLLRHFFASAAAWGTLDLEISHWSSDQDVARVLRLGVGNQGDDRVQVVQPERVVPVQSAARVVRTVGGFDVRDLAHFVDRAYDLGKFGTSERNWLGYKSFPSGLVLETVDEWRDLLAVFSGVGLLVDVGLERRCARWIVHDKQVVKDTMNLPVGPPLPLENEVSSAVV